MTIDTLVPPAAGIGRLARQAMAWWLDELARMIPRRLFGILGGRGGVGPPIRIGADGRILWPAAGSAIGAGRRSGVVTIELDRALIFESVVNLPAAAAASLRQILEHQIERLVPIDASKTAFAYRVESGGSAPGTIEVRLFIAKQATIEQAVAKVRDAGLDPRRVAVADWPGEGGAPVLWQADSTGSRHRALCRRLELTALALAAVGYVLYLHRLDLVEGGLEARLATAASTATAVRSLADEAARVDAALGLFQHRRAEMAPLAVVDALTGLVPLDSWLTRLAIHGREIEIAGYSPSASGLVARVERSPIFADPRFRSPITLAPDGKNEVFDLDLQIRPGARR